MDRVGTTMSEDEHCLARSGSCRVCERDRSIDLQVIPAGIAAQLRRLMATEYLNLIDGKPVIGLRTWDVEGIVPAETPEVAVALALGGRPAAGC